VTPTRNVSEREERTLVEKLKQLIQTINHGDDVDEKRVDDDATDDDDDDDDDRDARAILRCASTIAIPSSFSKPGTDPTSEPFTISCRQTSVSSD
jgi:hypothetical protein